VLSLRMRAITPKKDVDDLSRLVERGEQRAAEGDVKRSASAFPSPGAEKNFVFAPETRKEQRHTGKRHHADGVGHEGQRHVLAQPAQVADVLAFVRAVDD